MADDGLEPEGEAPEPVRRGGRPPRNTAQPESVKAHEQRVQKETEQAATDLNDLMALPQFRRWVWKHIASSGYFQRRGKRELNALGYVLHGRAEMGEEVWNQMRDTNPVGLIEMMRQALNEELR